MRCLLHRWASLGIKLASLARAHTDHTAAVHDILAGKYIEAAVSWLINLNCILTRAAAFHR